MTATLAEQLNYLADGNRLSRFRRAVAETVRPGSVVADLGCGFGPLGLMCLQAGAARVYGIDRTEAIEIAREAAARAGFAGRYICLREHTFRAELPERADLLICDHVGFFGIDYGIIDMLADARRRMLKPGGTVMPRRLTLFAAGVQSRDARRLAEAWTAAPVPAEFHWLRDYSVNTKHAHAFAADQIRTEAGELGTIDLTADNPDAFTFQAALTATGDALLDGIAGWFDCELMESVGMTNSPLVADRIDRPQAFLPFDRPIELRRGETVEVTISIRHGEGLIAWTVRDPRSGKRRRQSTWRSLVLARPQLSRDLDEPMALNREAAARRIVLGYVDGIRTRREIAQAVLADHPDLFPSASATARFVEDELARAARDE